MSKIIRFIVDKNEKDFSHIKLMSERLKLSILLCLNQRLCLNMTKIEELTNISRKTLYNWLKPLKKEYMVDSLKNIPLQKYVNKSNILLSQTSKFTNRKKDNYIEISKLNNKGYEYSIKYFSEYKGNPNKIYIENIFLSGATIKSLTKDTGLSKSNLGRIKNKITNKYNSKQNVDVINYLNKLFFYYKPFIIKQERPLWHKEQLVKLCLKLYRIGFSISSIEHILNSLTIIHSSEEKKLDQNIIDFCRICWQYIDNKKTKFCSILDEFFEQINDIDRNTLYESFNQIINKPIEKETSKKNKEIAIKIMKNINDEPINEVFSTQIMQEGSNLEGYLCQLSKTTKMLSFNELIKKLIEKVRYDVSLRETLKLEYKQNLEKKEFEYISSYKINKYLEEENSYKLQKTFGYNIFYSNKYNCFQIKDIKQYEYMKKTNYFIEKENIMSKKTYYIALDTEYVNISSGENKLLSWQSCISLDGKTLSKGYMKILKDKEPRPKLQEIIVNAFRDVGITPERLSGSHIVIVCHYCPAELAMLTDKKGEEKINDLKFLLKNMEYVRKTVIALKEQKYTITHKYIDEGKESKTCTWSYEFFDTKLISPAGASTLNDLSKSLSDKSFYKKDMNFYEISHMDWVLKNKKDKFVEYGINDARATLKAFLELQNKFQELEDFRKDTKTKKDTKLKKETKLKRTIGGAALSYYKKYLYLTYKKKLSDITGQGTTICELTKSHFSESYHGGRNETYFIGKAPEEYIYFDIDYKNAYPTCLAMLAGIDWDATPIKIHSLKQLLQKNNIEMHCTYVHARFKFPENTIYPSLPDFDPKYGLIYPLEGITYTTAHEILLAYKMGADIEILDAKLLQMKKTKNQVFYPFKSFYKQIIEKRNEHPKKSMMNLLYKEYANTLYGKVAQNVSKKKSAGLFDKETKELGESHITSAALASNITGIMRAALGELLNTCEELNKEKDEQIYLPLNAVTDGALIGVKKSSFSAETLKKIENKSYENIEEVLPCLIKKIKESHLIQELIKTRKDITGKDDFLEIKSISNKVWTFKTRGSVGYYNKELTLITKAGHKPPMIEDLYNDTVAIDGKKKRYEHKYFRPRTDEESAKWLLEQYYDYSQIQTYELSRLVTLKDLIFNDDIEDMITILKDRKVNLDFDYKRKPNFEREYPETKDSTELLNLDTLAFKDKAEMLIWRKTAENLRNSGKKIFDQRTTGYRSTPPKVQMAISNITEKRNFGEKGLKGVIVQYVIEAYIKDKLYPNTCTHNYNQIEEIFRDKRFCTQLEKKPFITRGIISNLKKRNFIPTNLPNNSYTKEIVKQTLRQLNIKPIQQVLGKLIS